MAEQKGMAPKIRWMLLLHAADALLQTVEILGLLLVIVPNLPKELSSLMDFARSCSLSFCVSSYRLLIFIGTTSALPPHNLCIFWLQRAVIFYLLTVYHSSTKSWGIAFGLYLMSTIWSSYSIVYFLPTRKWKLLPKNPSPGKTNNREVLVQKVDTIQRWMFWLERLVVLVCIFFTPRFARFSAVFFCFVSDFIYSILFSLRLEVDPFPAKPDYLFWIERLAVMIVEHHCTDQTSYSLDIARVLFFLTNSGYIVHSFFPRSIIQGFIPRAYTPKLREAEKGIQAEQKEATMEDERQKQKFQVYQGEDNNWEKELVAKYGFMDQISEFTCTGIEDEFPIQKFETHHQEERYNLEEKLVGTYGMMDHVSEFTFTKPEEINVESEIEEETPAERNYKSLREEDSEVVEAPKEEDRTFLDEGSAFDARRQWFDDMSSEGLHQIDTVSGNGDSDFMEYFMKTTTVDTEEVKRLRAENDNLKRENEALEREKESLEREEEALERDKKSLERGMEALKRENKSLEDELKAERLELEDTLLSWKMDCQKLDAMLVEEKMKSQALVEELDSHSKIEDQMLETLKTYKEDCRKWEQENKDVSAKFEEVTAAIGKEQQTLLNGQGHVCKYKERSKKWKSEKIALKQQLTAANFWYQYYFQVAMAANNWNQYYVYTINSLVESNTDLTKRLEGETRLSTRYHNRAYDYKKRCRALEEDRNNFTAKLCAANASSELYRSMLHDLAS